MYKHFELNNAHIKKNGNTTLGWFLAFNNHVTMCEPLLKQQPAQKPQSVLILFADFVVLT